jgi:hypothetical protein
MTTAVYSVSVRSALSWHRRRSLVLGVAFGVLAALMVAGVMSLGSSGPRPDVAAERRTAIVTWQAAVHPLVLSGGQVVALGPRTGIGQIQEGKLAPGVLADMAGGWARRLSALDAEIAAVPTPEFLRPAHALLNDAMDGYVTAARQLLAAATATGARQAELLAAAAAAGTAADRTYDRAIAAIAEWRAQLSLPTDWSGSS